jgi:hypothetical protein
MEIVAWLAWAFVAVLGVLWSVVWFLVAGWVSTLLQIGLLIATIYFLKYGWQRAPAEFIYADKDATRFRFEEGETRQLSFTFASAKGVTTSGTLEIAERCDGPTRHRPETPAGRLEPTGSWASAMAARTDRTIWP